jgi:isoquinoline 1-oxidoreductase beta subunit
LIEFTLNGETVQTDEDPNTPLLWIVRDQFGLKGSKFGCGAGLCGPCAMHTDVAEVAEVSVENGAINVHRVLCVVDCGTAVNPDIVRAQMEGGIIFGLTAALYGELNLEDGAIKQSNFHDYPMMRMADAPRIDVEIVDSGTEPTGVGEPGLPPIAPALANAVYRATGQRLRALPLRLS